VNEAMRHITIKDVTRLAEVGTSTASRALNNKGSVNPKRRL